MEDEEGEEEGRKKKMGEEVKFRERIKKGGEEEAMLSSVINSHIFYCDVLSARLLAITH